MRRQWFWNPVNQYYELWAVDAGGDQVGERYIGAVSLEAARHAGPWVLDQMCAARGWPRLDRYLAENRAIQRVRATVIINGDILQGARRAEPA